MPHLAFQPDQLTDVPFLPIGEVVTSYYLRMRVRGPPGRAGRHHAHPRRPRDLDRRDDPEGASRRRGADGHHPAHAPHRSRRTSSMPSRRSRRCRPCAARSCASGWKNSTDALCLHPRRVGGSARCRSAPSCWRAWRRMAGSRCRSRIRVSRAVELAALRRLDYRELAFAVLSRFIDDIPAADLKRIIAATLHRVGVRDRRDHAAGDAGAGTCTCFACRTAPRWRSRTSRCSSSATCSSMCSGAQRTLDQHPGRDVGRHRQLGRIRVARQARHQRVHAVAEGPDESVPAGADVLARQTRTSSISPSRGRSTSARTS